jgi:hypothetical protein
MIKLPTIKGFKLWPSQEMREAYWLPPFYRNFKKIMNTHPSELSSAFRGEYGG